MIRDEPIGIVLLQLGGPDSLDSVEPFLYNLFCDPDIIDLPFAFLFRRPLARFIARRRTAKVQGIYRRIGKKSPILKLTKRQALALEHRLRGTLNASVVIGMRYWHPLTGEAIEELRRRGVRRVVLLPLYPQYSKTTTGSSINEWNRQLGRDGQEELRVDVIEQYCENRLYIASLVRNITIAMRRVPAGDRPKIHLVFSAHGTPLKLVREGDPYREHILRTYNAVVRQGNFGVPHHLCYQSKVGPQKWLEPSLTDTVEALAKDHVSHVIAVPIAFVSDHSETLWEINIEAREHAKQLGIRHFDMSPALNTNPLFIEALADLVINKVAA